MNIAASNIKSRPVYQPLCPEPAATRHWLVLEANAQGADGCRALVHAFVPVQAALRVWSVGPLALDGLPVTALVDTAALASELVQAAGAFRVGDRLYVQGTEPFIWDVASLACAAGLTPEQVRLAHAGSLRRRVWCAHCHRFTENVSTSTVPCANCGRHLLVRDHFSRRHGAFMGVMVDAEAPGQRPAVQEVFP